MMQRTQALVVLFLLNHSAAVVTCALTFELDVKSLKLELFSTSYII